MIFAHIALPHSVTIFVHSLVRPPSSTCSRWAGWFNVVDTVPQHGRGYPTKRNIHVQQLGEWRWPRLAEARSTTKLHGFDSALSRRAAIASIIAADNIKWKPASIERRVEPAHSQLWLSSVITDFSGRRLGHVTCLSHHVSCDFVTSLIPAETTQYFTYEPII